MIITTNIIFNNLQTGHKEYFGHFEAIHGRRVVLGIVRVGENKISGSYIRIKKKYAEFVGVEVKEFVLSEKLSQEDLEKEVIAACSECDGVIVQLPISKHFNTSKVLEQIDLTKDIDQLRLTTLTNLPQFVQPVVFSIKEIIKDLKITLEGKRVVVLGQGFLVGKPFSQYLDSVEVEHVKLDKHSSLEDILENLKTADVLVTGIGQPAFVKPDMIERGCVVIDAGTSEDGDTIVGDVDRDCGEVAEMLVTTPGGVGPLTVCGLFNNLKIATEYVKV
jgi:methylenetetrahydrofolate dehydrogenase (NADP+)/methenyltetrahydrofolate cyclohydrolase